MSSRIKISDEDEKIAIAFRSSRAMANISQQDIADILNCSRITINKIELLKTVAAASSVIKLVSYMKSIGIEISIDEDVVVKKHFNKGE